MSEGVLDAFLYLSIVSNVIKYDLQGEVELLTGGKHRGSLRVSYKPANPVRGRSGENPEPTVTVRMEEDDE